MQLIDSYTTSLEKHGKLEQFKSLLANIIEEKKDLPYIPQTIMQGLEPMFNVTYPIIAILIFDYLTGLQKP